MLTSAAWYFFSRILNGASSIFLIYGLTRLLSPSEYGVYALCFSMISAFATLGFQWINLAVARFFPSNHCIVAQALSLFRLQALILLATSIPTIFGLYFFEKFQKAYILFPAGVILLAYLNLCQQIANSAGESRRYALLGNTRALVNLLCALVFAYFGWGELGALAAFPVACLVAIFIFGYTTTLTNAGEAGRKEISKRTLVRYGIPVSVAVSVLVFVDVIDKIIIKAYLGDAAVGAYAAAYDLTQQTVGAFLNILFLLYFPRVVKYWEAAKQEEAIIELNRSAGAILMIAPLVLGFFFGASHVVAALFFKAWPTDGQDFFIAAIALGVYFSAYKACIYDALLMLGKNYKKQIAINIIFIFSNLLFSLTLVPTFGITGAACSYCGSCFFAFLLSKRASTSVAVTNYDFWNIFKTAVGIFFVAGMLRFFLILIKDEESILFQFILSGFMSIFLAAVIICTLNISSARDNAIAYFNKITNRMA